MFRRLVESSGDLFIVTDIRFRILYVSPSVVPVFGLAQEEVLERNLFEFVPEIRRERWRENIFLGDLELQDEIELPVAGGRRAYFDVSIVNRLNDDDIEGIVIQLHEVTDKKLLERSLVNSNQQLDQVIFKTTHDLKAPLLSALGLVALAEKGDETEMRRYMTLIKKSLLKLDGFIEEMNGFFRNEKLAVQRQHIDLESLIREGLDDFNNLPERERVRVSLDVTGTVPFYSDAIRVKTIVTNIVSNAIKYSDLQKADPFITISVFINEDFCQLRIADNGIGIDTKFQNKIFDLFFRATTQSHGTGLGLFIVKDTVRKLSGTIEVKSMLGQGTTFEINIPNQIHQPIEVG